MCGGGEIGGGHGRLALRFGLVPFEADREPHGQTCDDETGGKEVELGRSEGEWDGTCFHGVFGVGRLG